MYFFSNFLSTTFLRYIFIHKYIYTHLLLVIYVLLVMIYLNYTKDAEKLLTEPTSQDLVKQTLMFFGVL